MSPHKLLTNWSNLLNLSVERKAKTVSGFFLMRSALMSSLTLQAVKRTLSTAWRKSFRTAGSGVGSDLRRCSSRRNSAENRLISEDRSSRGVFIVLLSTFYFSYTTTVTLDALFSGRGKPADITLVTA